MRRRMQRTRRRRTDQHELARVEAFTDAVLAIAITLLVLGLDVPSGLTESGLVAAMRGLGPELFSFVLSFLVIGRFWISHHRVFAHMEAADDRLLVLNGAFLLSVAFLPFPTAVLGEYMHYRPALLLYAVSVTVSGGLFALLWTHIAYLGRLLRPDVDDRLRRILLLRFLSVPVVFLASVPVIVADQRHLAAGMWLLLPPAARLLVGRRYHHG